MKTVEEYKQSMYADQDYAAVALTFRTALLKLAEAASAAIREYDGHHRLAIEIANAYSTVSGERFHRLGTKGVK